MTLEEMATPRPWVVAKDGRNGPILQVHTPSGEIVATFDHSSVAGSYSADRWEEACNANAALICHAVNHFPALVAALEWALGHCGPGTQYAEMQSSETDEGGLTRNAEDYILSASQAAEALALARNVEASK